MKNNSKKIVRLSDGLANRMFQYSCYLYLIHNGYEAYIDDSTPNYLEHDNVSWNKIFPEAKYKRASKLDCVKNCGGFDVVSKIIRHKFKFLSLCKKMESPFVYPSGETLDRYNYFIGVMQNANMVQNVSEQVKRAFVFEDFEPGSFNHRLVQKMLEENSVAIHVRKGEDYTSRINFQNTCPVEYYKKAIAYINDHVESPVFYVFSDNPKWVKDNLHDIDYELIDSNPITGWGNHFDMQLMTKCKHNIIANSTYSWWGAYLNMNVDKIVIAPQRWFNEQYISVEDSVSFTKCKGWHLF